MKLEWLINLRAECKAVGTKLFVKQFSALTPAAGKALIPANLQIHEFP
jgi:hypothetical protein